MTTRRGLNFGWRLGMVGLLGWAGALSSINHSAAQVIPDATLGAERSQVTPAVIQGIDSDRIDGGAVRGINLFHSFEQFSVRQGRGAYFSNPAGIENILSRVTGSSRSEILGRLGVLGNANLFLMNPNGIVFGPDARLDVNGSFIATTANSIQFENQGFFSTTNPEVPSSVLTINPSALVFSAQLANPGQILVQGNGQGTRLTTDLIDTQDALRVRGDRTLALVGGDLNLEGATLKTAGGRIELGSVAPGSSVRLIPVSKGWALDYTGIQNFQDVQLTQQATVDASGAGGGDIQVQGRQIQLSEGSQMEASTLGAESGGILRLAASDSINLRGSQTAQYATALFSEVYSTGSGSGGSVLIETKNLSLLDGSILSAQTGGSGQGGNISIEANNVAVINGSFLLTRTFGSGKGGNITIHADGLVEITGTNRAGRNTGIRADVNGKFGAQGGNITIEAKQLRVIGSQISASVFGSGQSGDLTVRATDAVEISGEIPTENGIAGFPGGLFALVNSNAEGRSGNLIVETKHLSISDGSKVQTITFGRGDAGALKIKADEVEVFETAKFNFFETGVFAGVGFDVFRNTELAKGTGGNLEIETNRLSIRGGVISVDTRGNGDGGKLFIQAHNSIELGPSADSEYSYSLITGSVRSNATGRGGDISLLAKSITLTGSESSISSAVSKGGIGQGGNIEIQADSLQLSDRASISAQSQGNGKAGNITIRADKRLTLNNSDIITSANNSSGGAISITAGKVRLAGDSDISSSVASGINGGGDIRIDAGYILALDDSDIFAFSKDGQGGNISLARAFFGVGFQSSSLNADPQTLQGNGRPDVNATGQVRSGTVNTPDNNLIQNGLIQLSQNLLDANTLLANSCIVRGRQTGSFFITGSGGLPVNPGNVTLSEFPTGEVRTVDESEVRKPGSGEDRGTRRRGDAEMFSVNSSVSAQTHPWKLGDPIVEPQGVYQLPDGQLVMSRECP